MFSMCSICSSPFRKFTSSWCSVYRLWQYYLMGVWVYLGCNKIHRKRQKDLRVAWKTGQCHYETSSCSLATLLLSAIFSIQKNTIIVNKNTLNLCHDRSYPCHYKSRQKQLSIRRKIKITTLLEKAKFKKANENVGVFSLFFKTFYYSYMYRSFFLVVFLLF